MRRTNTAARETSAGDNVPVGEAQTLLRDVRILTGDGVTDLPRGWVVLAGDAIVGVGAREPPPSPDTKVVALPGSAILPGVINAHAHGCTTGPLFSSGAAPLDAAQARANADRQLSQGVTTLINVCGLGLPEDLVALAGHPMRVLLGSTHLPEAIQAARIVDGCGLDEAHKSMTAERMLQLGAVAIGEVGSGATLGGGVAAYRYLPEAAADLLGSPLSPVDATALIDAAIGRDRLHRLDLEALRDAMSRVGLPSSGPAATSFSEAIVRYAQLPVRHSLATFADAAALSARTGVPPSSIPPHHPSGDCWRLRGRTRATVLCLSPGT